MRWGVAGFALGILLLQQQASLWPRSWLMLTSAGLVLGWIVSVASIRKWGGGVLRYPRWLSVIPCSPAVVRWTCFIGKFGAAILMGWVWASVMAHVNLADALAPELEDRDLIVVGVINGLPARSEYGQRFAFRIEQVEGTDAALVPKDMVLSWNSVVVAKKSAAVSNQTGLPKNTLQSGERWRLNVRMRLPHGAANPFGFDVEAWMLEQGFRASGSVRSDRHLPNKNQRLTEFVFSPGHCIGRVRAWLRDRILHALESQPYAPIMVALVIGEQNGISQADWNVFSRTGISHLISISGLHITMIAALIAKLTFYCWRHSFFTSAQLPLWLAAQKAAALAGTLTALMYVALAGFGVPAQRTLIMLSVIALALWYDRITRVSVVLALALALVLLVDPWAVLWPGFWLSFGAVALIFYTSAGRSAIVAPGSREAGAVLDADVGAAVGVGVGVGVGVAAGSFVHDKKNHGEPERVTRLIHGFQASMHRSTACCLAFWRNTVWPELLSSSHTQYVLTLGLVPLTLLLFSQISLISPLANALAIPLISFVVTPCALLGAVLPAPFNGWLLGAGHACLQGLVRILEWFSQFPWAVWNAPQPTLLSFGCALAGTIWLLAPSGWPLRWTGLVAWVPLCFQPATAPPEGQFWVTALDVGQGSAVLIETAHHRLLYDTGPIYSGESNAGNRVIVPYLKARGIRRLDGMIITHGDNDHSGGALPVLQEIPTDWLLSSMRADHPIVSIVESKQGKSALASCVAGQSWEWDGVRFEMQHPVASDYGKLKNTSNAMSCTLKVSRRGQQMGGIESSMLLTGDIEAKQERSLLARSSAAVDKPDDKLPLPLRASVILVPHHGSGSSSTEAFLKAVQPTLAVFQFGYRNRFHHPKPVVWQRYADLGILRLRNDMGGAIILHFGDTVQFQEYRQNHARYWYAPLPPDRY